MLYPPGINYAARDGVSNGERQSRRGSVRVRHIEDVNRVSSVLSLERRAGNNALCAKQFREWLTSS